MKFGWFILIVFLLVSISIGIHVRAYSNCDGGTVVKNTFDWPVCIK